MLSQKDAGKEVYCNSLLCGCFIIERKRIAFLRTAEYILSKMYKFRTLTIL